MTWQSIKKAIIKWCRRSSTGFTGVEEHCSPHYLAHIVPVKFNGSTFDRLCHFVAPHQMFLTGGEHSLQTQSLRSIWTQSYSIVVLATLLPWIHHTYHPFQLRDLDMSHHYEDRSSESTFRDSRSHSQDNSEPPDLPMPTCFRSRSHSYLRAIQAGCSQDDDTASMDSGCSPPLTDTTVRTYSTSTGKSASQSQSIDLLQIH